MKCADKHKLSPDERLSSYRGEGLDLGISRGGRRLCRRF